MGENGVTLGEGKDNFDGSYNIDTNLLLNEMKKKAQFLYLNSICFLRTKKNALIKIRVVIKKSLRDKRWAKLTESCISELLKTLTDLIFSLTSFRSL